MVAGVSNTERTMTLSVRGHSGITGQPITISITGVPEPLTEGVGHIVQAVVDRLADHINNPFPIDGEIRTEWPWPDPWWLG